jgi:hypothetical protein
MPKTISEMPKKSNVKEGKKPLGVQQEATPATAGMTGADAVADNKPKVPPKQSKPIVVKERPVVYPNLMLFCGSDMELIELPPLGKITVQQAKDWLGWENEQQYRERMVNADPNKEDTRKKAVKRIQSANSGMSEEGAVKKWEEELEQKYRFADCVGMPPWLLREDGGKGEKVICWNNDLNRPFYEETARQYAQDILNRCWAGPLSMPGETVNGETIIIGRTGQVESGQHRLIGLILAYEEWLAHPNRWKSKWEEEPFLESVVLLGVSEAQQVIQTLDNNRPRSQADAFYTSGIFRKMIPSERQECSKMLASAVTFLWNRTEASKINGGDLFKTHSAVNTFLERHKRMLKCIQHIHGINKANAVNPRALSMLKLSPGECAAMLYLMGSAASDIDDYRLCDPLPHEKKLKWEDMEVAEKFWTDLAESKPISKIVDDGGDISKAHPIRVALHKIVTADDDEVGSDNTKRLAILTRAWACVRANEPVTEEALDLTACYVEGKGESLLFVDKVTFGGIDCGPKVPKVGESGNTKESKESIEKAKKEEAERKRKEEDERQKLKIEMLKEQHRKRQEAAKGPLDKLAEKAAAGKALTRKEAQEQQTAKAKANDEEDAFVKEQLQKEIEVEIEEVDASEET